MTQGSAFLKQPEGFRHRHGSEQVLEMMQRVGVPLTLEGYLGALGVDSMAQLDAETISDIPNWLIEGVDPRIVPQNDITSNFSELENLRSVVKNR